VAVGLFVINESRNNLYEHKALRRVGYRPALPTLGDLAA
jgi:hypothetical protein